ncbi:STAS domain-containing protein [Alteromonas sp. A079]|uniref:STAS domain-containing protein n=1 Tax=Alteromonas sp. A079 TaxID=3410268 RepID=UPI003B9F8A23
MSLFQLNDDGNVVVHGDLDQVTLSKNFWDEVTPAQRAKISTQDTLIIDLSDMSRIDSAGLAWLINAIRDGKQLGIQVTLRNIPDKLSKLAKISDVETLLPVE